MGTTSSTIERTLPARYTGGAAGIIGIVKKLAITSCFFVITAVAVVCLIAPTVFGQGHNAATGNPSPAESVTARVDKLFAQWNKSDSPGCSLGVSRNGVPVYERGYGMANLELGVPTFQAIHRFRSRQPCNHCNFHPLEGRSLMSKTVGRLKFLQTNDTRTFLDDRPVVGRDLPYQLFLPIRPLNLNEVDGSAGAQPEMQS